INSHLLFTFKPIYKYFHIFNICNPMRLSLTRAVIFTSPLFVYDGQVVAGWKLGPGGVFCLAGHFGEPSPTGGD
ncbi:MAG: hypothetical protein QNL91_10205, partial [Candidatus Krumholzibacteria bacterium]|nr:hypothetical protein [Candidatus Krumholzibacteria bacterium]